MAAKGPRKNYTPVADIDDILCDPDRIPNPKHPERDMKGRLLPGHTANPRGPKPGDGALVKRWRKSIEKPPTPFHYNRAAQAIGMEPDELPVFESIGDLLCWLMEIRAIDGNLEAFRELGERVDPKPKRVDISVDAADHVRGMLTGESEQAEREAAEGYYDSLNETNGPQIH